MSTETICELGYCNEENGIGFRFRIPSNASATMKAICCTVKSEGGQDLQNVGGIPRSADNGVTPITVRNTLIPLLSIRPKTTYKGLDNLITVLPKILHMSTDNPIRAVIVHQGTLTGAVWTDVDTIESSVEFDVSATAITGGHEMFSTYVQTTSKNTGTNTQGILGKTVLWNRRDGQSGIFSVCAVRTTNSNASVLSSLIWDEIR